MNENVVNKEYCSLLTNLRILACTEYGEYIGTTSEKKIYCRYSSNWWNTLSDIIRLETWNCTYECLEKIYCFDIPEYINYLQSRPHEEYKLKDLHRCIELSIKGLKNLKNTYSYTYQSDTKGKYDKQFDTIIESYAEIHIKNIDDILESYLDVTDSDYESDVSVEPNCQDDVNSDNQNITKRDSPAIETEFAHSDDDEKQTIADAM